MFLQSQSRSAAHSVVSHRDVTEKAADSGRGNPPDYKTSETDSPCSIRIAGPWATFDGNTEKQRPPAHKQQQHVWADAEILRASQKESRWAQCASGDGQDNHRSGHWEVLLPWESFGKGTASRVPAATFGFIPTNEDPRLKIYIFKKYIYIFYHLFSREVLQNATRWPTSPPTKYTQPR